MPDEKHYFRLRKPPAEPTHITGPEGEPVDNPRAGEPRPFAGVSVEFAVPTMVDDRSAMVRQSVWVGTRDFLKQQAGALPSQCFEIEVAEDGQTITAEGFAARVLAEHDRFEPCDAPRKARAQRTSVTTDETPTGEEA